MYFDLFTLALKLVSNQFTFKPVWPNHIHYTLLIIFLLMIDCHNNTFLAVRVFDNNMVDHVYTEFFLTGMIVMYYKTC